MPKGKVLLKASTMRRAVLAMKKTGLVTKMVRVLPDGTFELAIAEQPPLEVSPELDGEIEKFVESTWDRDYGKPAA